MLEKKRNSEPMQDKLARKLANAVIGVQIKISDFMNKTFKLMNVKKLKFFLIAFCLWCGGYSVYLTVNAVSNSDNKQPSFYIEPIDMPVHLNRRAIEMIPSENYVDEKTYLQLQQFKRYMDSLRMNRRNIYDSIMHARPGLMDSVLQLEEIYHSQKQK